MLVLAGAGSGKTRVITYKIAWLLSHHNVNPRSVFAVTFTNKAAAEMKERVGELLSKERCKGLTVSTFHRLGLRIINEEIDATGRSAGFSLFDPADSVHLVKELLKADVSDDGLPERVRNQISSWKNELVSPDEAMHSANTSPVAAAAARIYGEYERYLKACNAVDLDDLISLPITLLKQFDNLRLKWQSRVQYLLVDEYQDTNTAQYELVRILMSNRDGCGLTAVGDDDQSIYAWRGAQPENLEQLGKDFTNLELVKLEQNYRSMGRILSLANTVIQNNPRPFDKTLWSALGLGDPALIIAGETDEREAERVVSNLMQHRFATQNSYADYAILYRGNHQSRMLEKKLREMRIPYYLSGGLSFFERSEIKDVMAYLRLLANPKDDTAFVRAINTPRRGVGAVALEALSQIARVEGEGLFNAIRSNALNGALPPSRCTNLVAFTQLIDELVEYAEVHSVTRAVNELLERIDYEGWLIKTSATPEQAEARQKNVEELISWISSIAQSDADKSLADVVQTVGLMGILDKNDPDEDAQVVSLMTLHAAKGLEWPHVTIVGLEEELLPHRSSIEEERIDEERRLFYVGITRAQRQLVLSHAKKRQRFGETLECEPSRFFDELDPEHIVWQDAVLADSNETQKVGSAHLAAMRELLGK